MRRLSERVDHVAGTALCLCRGQLERLHSLLQHGDQHARFEAGTALIVRSYTLHRELDFSFADLLSQCDELLYLSGIRSYHLRPLRVHRSQFTLTSPLRDYIIADARKRKRLRENTISEVKHSE